MTALTKSVARDGQQSKLIELKAKADVKIYRGAKVMVGADGYVAPSAPEAGAAFAGISRTEVDMTGLVSGSCAIEVEERDSYYVNIAAAVQADVFKEVFSLDDNTVSLANAGTQQSAGKIIEVVSATKVLVQPNPNSTK